MIRLTTYNKPILIGVLVLFFLSSVAVATDLPDKRARFLEKIKHLPPALGPTDDPPPPPVIAVAEWEPMTGVLVNYEYPGGLLIPLHLVREMAEDIEVMTVVADERRMQQALDLYVEAGVDTSNCTFLFTGAGNGPYTRDYGPWYIINGNDELGINDNVYTPAGNPDDLVNQFLGDSLGNPVYQSGLNADGGNWMTDGMGIAMTSDYTYWANRPLSHEEIDGILEDYLGISNHLNISIWYGWGHIDTFAKMLDPGRIMIIQMDPPHPSLEAAAEYISTLMSSYGRPYEVYRVQGQGYSNTLFLNDKVLVPLFGDATDSMAVVAFQQAMPGYDVQGFYFSSFTYGDALHCRTHEMADPGMLRIVHVPIHDRENDGSNYALEANIHPYSGEDLIGPPLILWKVEGGSYSATAMTQVADYTYAGEIPLQPDGTDLYYYIEAEDASGRLEHHPYIGEGNPHHFYVGPDNEAPVVEFNPPGSIQASAWPVPIRAYALDDRWISVVAAEYTINGIAQPDCDMPLIEPFAVCYGCTPTGIVQAGDVVEMRIRAVDTSVNQNTAYSPYYTIAVDGGLEVASGRLESRIYPNPFNPLTTIRFELEEADLVKLAVYDVAGRKVADLVNGWRDGGMHEVTWDGSQMTSGIYLYRLEAGDFSASGKMVLMK